MMGANGMNVSKGGFFILITGLGMVWYYFTLFLVNKIAIINIKLNPIGVRILINLSLSVVSIILILSNLK